MNTQDKLLLRLKFELNEHNYSYSPLFWMKKNELQADMAQDFNIDVQDSKYMKISLVAVRGRMGPQSN